MPKDYSISAVVLSSNSEKKIGKCLESLKGWADEVIVVDGQSTDNTIKIAEGFGAHVHSHPFLGSFAGERNFGTDKAKSEWVLQLDSDEMVTDDFKKKCDSTLGKTNFAAFKFRRKNIFLGHEFRYGGWYHWSQHMLRKGYAHYEGRVHEKMIVKGDVGFLDADIMHEPFDSISELIERQNRYTELQTADMLEQEKDLSIKKIKYNLKYKPLALFRKMYFNKKGYKEGIYGFIFAVLFSYVHFLKWAKVWERIRHKKNILVIRNDRFGEFLLNIPAIRALKESYKDSKIFIAVDPYVAELAQAVPGADEVVYWKSGRHSIVDIINFARVLRRRNIDIAVMMNPSRDSNIVAYLAGISKRVGYAHKWDFLLTKKIEDSKHLGRMHEVEYNLDLVKLIGAGTDDKSLSLKIDVIESHAIPVGLNPTAAVGFIAVHPWTSDPVKQWPPERFRELSLRLAKELDTDVLIIGGKENLENSAGYNYLNDRIFNLTGKTTLLQLAAILRKCRLLISGDSGPVHLASSVGTPVIALFRNDIAGKSAKRWGPRGDKDILIEKARLSDITIEEVLNKAKE